MYQVNITKSSKNKNIILIDTLQNCSVLIFTFCFLSMKETTKRSKFPVEISVIVISPYNIGIPVPVNKRIMVFFEPSPAFQPYLSLILLF